MNKPTLIFEGMVVGRAVPWKAPNVTRRGTFRDKKVKKWQSHVKWQTLQYKQGEPYDGPVMLDLKFIMRGRSGLLPDLTNLTKALEDVLQGIVYVNDRQVCKQVTERIVGDKSTKECTLIRVWSI